jgi:hypothetical protein
MAGSVFNLLGKSRMLIKDYHVYNVFCTAIYFTYMDIIAAKVKT